MSVELARRARTLALASTLSVALCGCYTPGYNTYATPRTTPERGIGAGFHIQASGYAGELENQKNKKYIAPTPPGVSGRIGLGENWDMGTRVGVAFPWDGNASALDFGGDLKWLALPGEALDIALNPAAGLTFLTGEVMDRYGYLYTTDVRHWHVDLPVVAGLNLDRALTVVFSPGVVLGWYTPELEPFAHARRGRLVNGVAPRLGVGLNVRTGVSFAIQPETTFVYSTAEDNHRLIYTVGVGFQLGKLPKMLRPAAAR
jgi:hypothetical protein